jgi:hypothetical protein
MIPLFFEKFKKKFYSTAIPGWGKKKRPIKLKLRQWQEKLLIKSSLENPIGQLVNQNNLIFLPQKSQEKPIPIINEGKAIKAKQIFFKQQSVGDLLKVEHRRRLKKIIRKKEYYVKRTKINKEQLKNNLKGN